MADQDTRLFVSHLHAKVTQEILRDVFLQAGPLEDVYIPHRRGEGGQRVVDPETQEPVHRGFGFVEYGATNGASYAIALFDGLQLFGQSIHVRLSRPTGGQARTDPTARAANHKEAPGTTRDPPRARRRSRERGERRRDDRERSVERRREGSRERRRSDDSRERDRERRKEREREREASPRRERSRDDRAAAERGGRGWSRRDNGRRHDDEGDLRRAAASWARHSSHSGHDDRHREREPRRTRSGDGREHGHDRPRERGRERLPLALLDQGLGSGVSPYPLRSSHSRPPREETPVSAGTYLGAHVPLLPPRQAAPREASRRQPRGAVDGWR